MNQEDLDLIKEEFEKHNATNMKSSVITKGLIEKLLNNYNTCIYIENCYDDEPDIPYEEWKRLHETEEGRRKYEDMVKEDEPRRKRFCNWQEPHEEGIWNYTKEDVRISAKDTLTFLKKESYKNPRFYIGENENGVSLYYYSRDMDEIDYWFDFFNENE